MMRTLLAAMFLAVAVPAAAQDRDGPFRIGDDVFAAGGAVLHADEGADDLFAAGERVEVAAPLTGSAYLAGRRVSVAAEVGGDLTAFGADVTVSAPVAGDATLAGYDVTVDAPVGEDLRAGGTHVAVNAPVAGTALLSGDTVTIDAAIAGDTTVAASTVRFGEGASIGGRFVLHDDPDRPTAVPASVAPAERIERRPLPDDPQHATLPVRQSWLSTARGLLGGAIFIAALATLAAAIAPHGTERLLDIVDERPFRTFGIGFLTLAALLGTALLLVMTLIGIVVAPLVLAAAALLAFLAYVLAAWLTGRAIWGWAGALPPDTLWERALTALIGAVVLGLVALVPFVGWLALLALTLTALGALAVAVLRPEFRA